MKIAEKIFNYRKEHGITQAALGEMLGVSDKVVSKWETGESLPSTELLPVVADCLGVSIDELFDRKIKTETDICKAANNYFRAVPSENAVAELQSLISYSIEGIAYKHSEERGWYKPQILAEIDTEWLELIKNKDPRPQMYYDNRNMLKELIVNVENDNLKFAFLQRFKDDSFTNILNHYNTYLPILKALSAENADKMLKYLFSNGAPNQLTAAHLSENTGVSVDKSESFLINLHDIFKDNLPSIRQACIEGKHYNVYPNPITSKLQLVIASAYFAAESWGGER